MNKLTKAELFTTRKTVLMQEDERCGMGFMREYVIDNIDALTVVSVFSNNSTPYFSAKAKQFPKRFKVSELSELYDCDISRGPACKLLIIDLTYKSNKEIMFEVLRLLATKSRTRIVVISDYEEGEFLFWASLVNCIMRVGDICKHRHTKYAFDSISDDEDEKPKKLTKKVLEDSDSEDEKPKKLKKKVPEEDD